MVCTTGENPGSGTNLEGRLGNPKGRCHGKVGHGLGLDALYLLGNETETVAKVNNGSLHTGTGLGGEDETGRHLLADTDTEEVNLQGGLIDSDEGSYLEHVALQARTLVAGEVQGVVLQE